MTAIKFCGIARARDAELAVDLGVHALGFVFWPKSPRSVSFEQAADIVRLVPPTVATIGVFVDPTVEELAFALYTVGVSALQVHGDAVDWNAVRDVSPRAIRAVRLGEAQGDVVPPVHESTTILLDAHDPVRIGGSGQVIDWPRAAAVAARRRVILAGGLTPANVGEAVRTVRPYAVDVASGVEERPGIKDPVKMRAFVEAVRQTDSLEGTSLGVPGSSTWR